MITLLAISGSLRKGSLNTRLIQRIPTIAGDAYTIDVFSDLQRLPHFNPDDELSNDEFVIDWMRRMRAADGFLVSTPEYAHGLPGTLKNALDWLVSTDAFIEKPFALLHACSRSTYATQSLIEILKTMSGLHVVQADVIIDLRRNDEHADAILLEESSNTRIQASLAIMAEFILGC